MIVDDLHWVDEPSLRFLSFLLNRLEGLPLLIVTALRPAEPCAAAYLLKLITTDPACRSLHPAPLSKAGVSALLATVLARPADPAFAQACHQLTGGNPLLLTTLADALGAEHTPPTASGIPRMEQIGPQVLAHRVDLELARLPQWHMRVLQAIAVLGPDATRTPLAHLTQLPPGDVLQALGDLESTTLIQPTRTHDTGQMHSAHGRAVYEITPPLVRATVYERIDATRRDAYHRRAAAVLDTPDTSAEHAAAHLLRLPPAGDPKTVTVLHRAATEALQHSAPAAANRYLSRALAEPPLAEQRLTLLTEAGHAALPVDLNAATGYLTGALNLTEAPRQRAELSAALSLAMLYVERIEEAVEILIKTIDALPEREDDLRRALEALLLDVPTIAIGWQKLNTRLPQLRALPRSDTLGALQLDCVIAAQDSYAGDPAALDRALRAVRSPVLMKSTAQGATIAIVGYFALTVAHPDAGIAAHDDLITRVRTDGAPSTLCAAHVYRGMGYLRSGDLAEAENDLREAMRLAELTGFIIAFPVINGLLAEVLVDAGRIEEAETTLGPPPPDPLPSIGLWFFNLQGRACLLRAQGRHEEALEAALAAGARFAEHGGHNPAVVAWRSHAALSLHALGRTEEARAHAGEEVALARRFGAPHVLGHALRIEGLLTPGSQGLQLLQQAVDILQTSCARGEHAHALIDLGAGLRRSNARAQARTALSQGIDLAERCGALSLVETARTELRAAGARPRTNAITGPGALTPSERRVADLAARGHPNRQIAQELFVTVKTFEVHLSATYRKLGITTRTHLPSALDRHPTDDKL
ncbi:LuxR C-terminal-related transcriptional regulator [Streptomyces sp. NPDC055109]